MAALYSDEEFPLDTVAALRLLGHDVLTPLQAGNANKGIPDDQLLQYAIEHVRTVVTRNRRDFFRLHRQVPNHRGIIVCTDDGDHSALAKRINEQIQKQEPLAGKLIRVVRPQR